MYTDVFIYHTKPIKEMLGDLGWWLKKEQSDIFVKEIQLRVTLILGWLLFLFSGIHVKGLCGEISALIDVEVAGCFKPVLTDKWDPKIDNKKGLKPFIWNVLGRTKGRLKESWPNIRNLAH